MTIILARRVAGVNRFLKCAILLVLSYPCRIQAQTTGGDAARGEQLLSDLGCVGCHRGNGRGGNPASDLGTRFARNYAPGYLVGVMWNHASSMAAKFETTPLDENQASDLFAYFASRRFFERPGDGGRGKQVFIEKHCNACHGISKPLSGEAKPVLEWHSLRDPIAFAQEMWNHAPLMVPAFAQKGIEYPRLTSQEVNDLLILRGESSHDPRSRTPLSTRFRPYWRRAVSNDGLWRLSSG